MITEAELRMMLQGCDHRITSEPTGHLKARVNDRLRASQFLNQLSQLNLDFSDHSYGDRLVVIIEPCSQSQSHAQTA